MPAAQRTSDAQVGFGARPGETAWHHDWKYMFETCGAKLERPHERHGYDHRADIMLPSGTVVEIQRGTLTAAEAQRRELCYRRMVWILDGTMLGDRLHVGKWYGEYTCGVWIKNGPRWWVPLRQPRYIDLGGGQLLQVNTLDLVYRDGGFRPRRVLGRVTWLTRQNFIAWAVTNL